MIRKSQQLAVTVKERITNSNIFPAVVEEVYGEKVSVSLVGNGQLFMNLSVVGGPVIKGDIVSIDFTSKPFIVLARGASKETSSRSTAIRQLPRYPGIASDSISSLRICLFSGGQLKETFEPNITGLSDANSLSVEGDTIWLPNGEFVGDIGASIGVSMCGQSPSTTKILGEVTLANGSVISNIGIINVQDSGDEIFALTAPFSGTPAVVENCEVHCYQFGIGRANGVRIRPQTDNIFIKNSIIVADSVGGLAYAIKCEDGSCLDIGYGEVLFSKLYGKTDWIDGEEVSVYSVTEGLSSLDSYSIS